MALPQFKYHPNPVATGAVVKGTRACACCGKKRGFVYAAAPYCTANNMEEKICPWCIADGSAAAKYKATFAQDIETTLPEPIAKEVMERTPGYTTWQGENWLCHCDDACEFHGDLSRESLLTLPPDTEAQFLAENDWVSDWSEVKAGYQPGSDFALYKFVCRHCGIVRLGADIA